MLEIIDYPANGEVISKLSGRIDGVSSDEINSYIAELLDKGRRKIILDFESVNYISSAGLRVLLLNQKKISSAGGEILFFKLPQSILEVLRLSGFLKIFKIHGEENNLGLASKSEDTSNLSKEIFNGISFEKLFKSKTKSEIISIGNIAKLELSGYESSDLIKLNAQNTKFALGIGAIGDNWTELCEYFGESVVIGGNIFVYPAVKRPAVDYMLYSGEMKNFSFSFLNGFEIRGSYSELISFKMTNSFINITTLLDSISGFLKYRNFGFALIGECKGFMGMNLRKIPTMNNKPPQNKTIFDEDNFAEWVNFPVDQDSFNSTLSGIGIYCNSSELKQNKYSKILTGDSNFHLHCGVFERKLLSYKTDTFEKDLAIITGELNCTKVQHVLPDTIMSMGTIAIFKLED